MTLVEIKKLSKKQLAERYPFVVSRDYNGKLYNDTDGEPHIELFFGGWTDILFCWAEKVKPIFDSMPEKDKNDFYIMELKEKFGGMRLYTTYDPTGPFSKINEYTHMVEHLSYYTCLNCGKITQNSSRKKLVAWKSKGGWITYNCKQCAKKRVYDDVKTYGVSNKYFKKWLHQKPSCCNIITQLFRDRYIREDTDWVSKIVLYDKSGKHYYTYDCHELLKDLI